VKGHSEDEFAEECGISRRHIELDAGEAQRRLAETVEDDAEIRAEVLGALRMLQSDNMQLRELALKKNQIRTAIEANRIRLETLKLFIVASGAEPPKKMEVGGNLGELFGLALKDPEPD
jgi:hypothetical protein